jgi:hypothetical protein
MLTGCLFDLHLHDRGSVGFPVHVKPDDTPRDLFSDAAPSWAKPQANVAPSAWETLKTDWGLSGDLHGEDAKSLVRDLFHLTLAIAHAPQYQLDHQDALAHDWLHVPIPKDRRTFQNIADVGEKVATLLDPLREVTTLLEDILGPRQRALATPSATEGRIILDTDLVVTVSYFGAAKGGWQGRAFGGDEVSDSAWGEQTGDLYLNEAVYLANVPDRVWRYELGGYPVIKKWLGYRDSKRRGGRPLTHEELDQLRSIVHRIAALLVLQNQLDEAYDLSTADAFTPAQLGLP